MFGLRNNLSQGKTLKQHWVLIAGRVKYYTACFFFSPNLHFLVQDVSGGAQTF